MADTISFIDHPSGRERMELKLSTDEVCEIIENPSQRQRRLFVDRVLTLTPGISSARCHEAMQELCLEPGITVGDLKVFQRINLADRVRRWARDKITDPV